VFQVGVPEVLGYRDTMKALQKLDPALRRETVKEIRKAMAPLQAKARALTPATAPLSGMVRGRLAYSSKARSGVRIRVGGRARRNAKSWPLASLVQVDPAGSVFDMAGRRSTGSTPQGQALIRGLNARHGTASRAMWRVMDNGGADDVRRNVLAAVKNASEQVNRELLTYRAGGLT
jgi:hypothetical protein